MIDAPAPRVLLPFVILQEAAALLAHTPNTADGIREALEATRIAIGAQSLQLSTTGCAPAGATRVVAPVTTRTAGAPTQYFGNLGAEFGGAPPRLIETLLATVADLLAVALSRDAHAAALQFEITARTAEIAEHRAFIECVVDSLPVGLYVVDRQYRIHAWNHKREIGLQGVLRADAIGRTIFDVMHRQPAALLKREFDEAFSSGKLQQFQMDSDAFGELRSYRMSKIPMRMGGGEVTHVITIGEDVTEWKAAIDRTAQSEKLAALGQLAAGVMHEINNPLATIAACAESLTLLEQEPGVNSGGGEFLRIIDLEVQRCKRIVNGLLDFSRPKPATREPLELNALVEQGMFLLRHHPKYKRVQMVPDFDVSVPLFIDGDADQLVQVLIALVINAMDASSEGGRVTVRTRFVPGRSAPAGSTAIAAATITLEVLDEGAGIPRALQAKVFEPFFTTKPQGEGTGLGLAICYGIVTDHAGVLELVPSEVGARFRMTFPVSPTMAQP